MGFLAGHQLEKKNGEKVDAETALAGKKVVLYFSAAWCGDCTPITAKLATLYEMANEDEDVLEIVWVSADEDKEGMDQYMKKHGDYLHIPYDSPLRSEVHHPPPPPPPSPNHTHAYAIESVTHTHTLHSFPRRTAASADATSRGTRVWRGRTACRRL